MKQVVVFILVAILMAWAVPSFGGDADKCIDVETASAKDLQALKGVGPALSKKIVDYRKAQRTAATKAKKAKWNFRNWATLMKVDGVGDKVCKDNLAAVCFGGKAQKTCPKPKK